MSPRAKNKHDSARYNASAPSPYGSRVSLIATCCLPHPADIVPKFPVSVSVWRKAERTRRLGPDICYVTGLVPFLLPEDGHDWNLAVMVVVRCPKTFTTCASANKPGSPGAAAARALGTGVEMN